MGAGPKTEEMAVMGTPSPEAWRRGVLLLAEMGWDRKTSKPQGHLNSEAFPADGSVMMILGTRLRQHLPLRERKGTKKLRLMNT